MAVVAAIGAWCFSFNIEASMRRYVLQKYLEKLKQSRTYANPAFEGTHFGGALEKYVWSSTDLIKESIGAMSIATIAIYNNFTITAVTLIFLSVLSIFGKSLLKMLKFARLQLSRKRRQLTEKLKNRRLGVYSVDQEIAVYYSIEELGAARLKMQAIRTVLSATGAGISCVWIVLAGVVMQENFAIGIALTAVSLRLTQDITRFVEVLVVWLGETIHMEKLR